MLYLRLLVAALFASVRARRDLVLENLALRHQLAVYTRSRRRPRLRRPTRPRRLVARARWCRKMAGVRPGTAPAPRPRFEDRPAGVEGHREALPGALVPRGAGPASAGSRGGRRSCRDRGSGRRSLGRSAAPHRGRAPPRRGDDSDSGARAERLAMRRPPLRLRAPLSSSCGRPCIRSAHGPARRPSPSRPRPARDASSRGD